MPAKPRSTGTALVPEQIQRAILLLRGHKVMLDFDLARLYGVETKVLNKAVKRNLSRFPDDFMFELSEEEFAGLRFQFGTSRWGGRRYRPYAFTEQGVAMLSSVLRSERAVNVNIEIMRAFVRLRGSLASDDEFHKRLDELEQRYDKQFVVVFKAIRALMDVEAARRAAKPKRQIGFRSDEK